MVFLTHTRTRMRERTEGRERGGGGGGASCKAERLKTVWNQPLWYCLWRPVFYCSFEGTGRRNVTVCARVSVCVYVSVRACVCVCVCVF